MTKIESIISEHTAAIEALETALATDFDVPAQRLINHAFARMGVPRFDATGDVWEQIVCQRNGWEYETPESDMMQRWARY